MSTATRAFTLVVLLAVVARQHWAWVEDMLVPQAAVEPVPHVPA